MTGYQSKKKAASAKTIDEVNWSDHEPDGRRATAQDKPLTKEHGFMNYAHQLMVKCFNEEHDKHKRTTMDKDDDINPTPPAAQPAQEPKVRTGDCLLCGVCASEGHKIQAQRPWVEPTGNEWFEWWRVSPIADSTEAEIDFADFLIIAKAVVAKLKEKNA